MVCRFKIKQPNFNLIALLYGIHVSSVFNLAGSSNCVCCYLACFAIIVTHITLPPVDQHLYLKPLKTQLIIVLFFSFITKSRNFFMFEPASFSHENARVKHKCHCAHRRKILVKNVKIVTLLFNPSQILKFYSVSM